MRVSAMQNYAAAREAGLRFYLEEIGGEAVLAREGEARAAKLKAQVSGSASVILRNQGNGNCSPSQTTTLWYPNDGSAPPKLKAQVSGLSFQSGFSCCKRRLRRAQSTAAPSSGARSDCLRMHPAELC